MTLNQLVCRAAGTYPDAFILNYWDPDAQEPKKNPQGGDSLALFVAQELADTFDEDADDGTQIATAVRAMQTAVDELQAVAHALSDLAVERVAA